MSDDAPINDADHSRAKKRLANELRPYIILQAVILLVVAPGYTGHALNLPGWEVPRH